MTAPTAPLPPRNLLDRETSPYLLQHRDNPVHWRPWGRPALAEAAAADKPILLSIGYAACHWCHVMAHESFEDAATAALMNHLFINIKVDREERPEIDQIYQTALSLMGEQGGWPLTMFLTPAGHPFWGGTYFPPNARYGRPGFPDVLRQVADVYHQDPGCITTNTKALTDGLTKLAAARPGTGDTPPELLDRMAERILAEIDPAQGGLGHAPKFPHPPALDLLWRAWRRTGQPRYRDAVTLTLTRMSQGGIYDHLGGGFARYSTDDQWLVPHFEKMLYDNAQILDLLTQAWQGTRDPLYRARANETVDWLLREMIAENGAFASTLDADSEGEEGRFYVWHHEEIDRVLGPEDAAVFKPIYDVTPSGNWHGRTILNRRHHPNLLDSMTETRLGQCRHRLLEARAARTRPGWDDKVLADWNGLMIDALCRAAFAFGRDDWRAAAERAYAAIVSDMSSADGRLSHSWRRGRVTGPGLLDDHAAMANAALSLFELTDRGDYLHHAQRWINLLNRHFWDATAGGYFTTADDAETLIIRPRQAVDAATPSGNGLAARALARFHLLTGDATSHDRTVALLAAFGADLERTAFGVATLVSAGELLRDAMTLVLVGPRSARDSDDLLAIVAGMPHPNLVRQRVESGSDLAPSHPAYGRRMHEGRTTAHVCRGRTCSLPITAPEALREALGDPV
jgi:uncharacterized protein YyaL (SSP411 family)